MLSPLFPTSVTSTACGLSQEILGKIGGGYAGDSRTLSNLGLITNRNKHKKNVAGLCMNAV
jgi:hypothetical protein